MNIPDLSQIYPRLLQIFLFFMRTASRELEELYKKRVIKKKIIKRVGKGKDTYYIFVTE